MFGSMKMNKTKVIEKRKRVEEEVDKTLSLMDRLETLETDPYFFTRLKAAIATGDRQRKRLPGFGPVVEVLKPAFVALLIILNLLSILLVTGGNSDATVEKDIYITALAQDYSLESDSYWTYPGEKNPGGER